jgi:hypothetical protein
VRRERRKKKPMDSYKFVTIVEIAEESLENSLLRHGQRVYDVAQRRFEFVLKEMEDNETNNS